MTAWLNYFNTLSLTEDRQRHFEQAAAESITQQHRIEAEDNTEFDEFLRQYFAQ